MFVQEVLVNTYLVGCLLVILMFVLFEIFSKVKIMRHGWVVALFVVAGSWLCLGYVFYKLIKQDEKSFTSNF